MKLYFRYTTLACEAQMRRMAGSNKTLAANYNATRVHNHCVATAREALANNNSMAMTGDRR